MTVRCAIYARVSTDKQGESLENQVAYATEYIHRLGSRYEVSDSLLYTDFDQSGYYTRFVDRPAMQRALTDARNGCFDVIVFKEISRISRDQAEHVEIVSRFGAAKVRVIAINDNLDTDRSETLDLLGIHSVMAEMESKRISSRVSSGKKALARRGVWVGEAPIGYLVNRETRLLVIDERYAHTVQTIFRLFTEEAAGLLRVAAHLNEHGILTRRHNPWSRITVSHVLRNPAYMGDLVYGKTRNVLKRIYGDTGYRKMKGRQEIPETDWIRVKDVHPALVSRETFQCAQTLLANRKVHSGMGGVKAPIPRGSNPLHGMLFCAYCDSRLMRQTRRAGNRTYAYYVCSKAFHQGRRACLQHNLSATMLEQVLAGYLQRLIPVDVQNKICRIRLLRSTGSSRPQSKIAIEHALCQAETALADVLVQADLSERAQASVKASLCGRISALEAKLAELENLTRMEAEMAEVQRDQTFTVRQWLAQADFLAQVLPQLVERVVMRDDELTHLQLRCQLDLSPENIHLDGTL